MEPTNSPKVAVAILCWNGKEFLTKFLPSIVRSDYPNFEVYVIDNLSQDTSVSFVKNEYPDVKVIELGKNLGFAGGYNTALKEIEADYFIILNQDVQVDPGWIFPIVEMMENDGEIAACQPKVKAFYEQTHFEYAGAAGGFIDYLGYPFCRGRVFDHSEEDKGQFDDAIEISWASGAALFIRPKVFFDMGGFDEYFFAHMEEIDLCCRIKNAGYKIMYCPDSVVYHVGGGSLAQGHPKKIYLNFRNSLRTTLKNYPSSGIFRVMLLRFILDDIAAVRALLRFKFKEFFAIAKADAHFVLSLPKWIGKRKQTNKMTKEKGIGKSRLQENGFYSKSIVWQYFMNKKKTFKELF